MHGQMDRIQDTHTQSAVLSPIHFSMSGHSVSSSSSSYCLWPCEGSGEYARHANEHKLENAVWCQAERQAHAILANSQGKKRMEVRLDQSARAKFGPEN